jgi:hypothetical protein
MSVADAALYAATYWSRNDAITMVAIAACESFCENDAHGDSFWSLSCYQATQRGIPCNMDNPAFAVIYNAVVAEYDPYDCNEYTSFGLWQVNTRWNPDKLERHTGSTDPCVWAQNLIDAHFNAVLAHEVWEELGFAGWSTYNNDAYLQFLDDATIAVDAALEILRPRPPWPPPPHFIPDYFRALTPVDPPSDAVPDFRDLEPVEPP